MKTSEKILKYTKKGSNGCLEWTRGKNRLGYGKIKVDGKDWRVHRYIWFLNHGKIPDGMFVCHKCDNPSCVKLEHLFIGSPQDNMDDMRKKGRDNYNPGKHANHSRAKLTWPDVIKIRGLGSSKTNKEIAEIFGIHPTTVCNIQTYKTWRFNEE